MHYFKSEWIIGTALGLSILGSSFADNRQEARTFEPLTVKYLRVQGLRRAVRFYRPSTMPERPALVLALHGSGGDGERLRRLTDRALERVADQNGFLVAYPDALGGQWHDCRAKAPHATALAGLDDIEFLRVVASKSQAIAGGPLAGVFIVGYSNGGHLAFRAALEDPDAFTAFATIGAHLPVPEECACYSSDAPVSILLMSGTEDPINPWEGGVVQSPSGEVLGSVLSAKATAHYFRDLLHAAHDPVRKRHTDHDPDDGTWLETLRWKGQGRHEVELLAVHGGGHSLPHPTAPFPAKLVGRTSRDADGAELIWDFFTRNASATE